MQNKNAEHVSSQPALPVAKVSSVAALSNRALFMGVVLVVLISIAGYVMLMQVASAHLESRNIENQSRLAQQLQNRLASYLDRVGTVAADPALVAVLKQPVLLSTRERELASAMNASRVRLIPVGLEQQSLGDYPHLTYSELDLIHQAQANVAPSFEFHRIAKVQAHLDIVHALKQGDDWAGFLVVSFDAAVLHDAIKSLYMPKAYLELSQSLSDTSSAAILSWGDSTLKGNARPISSEVAGTQWQLSYWSELDQWQVFGVSWQWLYFLALLAVIFIWALVIILFRRQLENAVFSSGEAFVSYVHDRLNEHWLGKQYEAALTDFEPAFLRLQHLNWCGQAENKNEADVPSAVDAVDEANEASEFGESYVDLLYQKKESMEVGDVATNTEAATLISAEMDIDVPQSIFRAYDIRGIVGEALTPAVAYQIGLSFGTEALKQGEQTVVVGRDGRLSGPALSRSLIEGLRASGRDVVDLGLVPTPLVYFATHYLSFRSAIMVTGSHNPVDYNGFKMVLRGERLSAENIKQLYKRILVRDYANGEGGLVAKDLVADYMGYISSDIKLDRELSVVLDCGNGAASEIAPVLLRGIGCQVVELYCEIDGNFPNHHPDPGKAENMKGLVAAVKEHKADIGLALDGDGDRLGVVDSAGNIFWPDRQMMLFAIDLLSTSPGAKIIFDIKCSRHLQRLIEEYGGQPIMWKSGHSMINARLKETGAKLAGELSGHIFFNDRWFGFDDGMYAAARLLEILSRDERSSYEIFSQLPDAVSTPELTLALPEGEHLKFMERLLKTADFSGAQLIKIDGLRVEYEDGWGLVRASNTSPCLTFRFEAEDNEAIDRIMAEFKKVLMGFDDALQLPF